MKLRDVAVSELLHGEPEKAALLYSLSGLQEAKLPEFSEFWIDFSKRRWLASRQSKAVPQVNICCWSLSHNPAGRAITLAEAYKPHANVKIIGSVLPNYGDQLWKPIRTTSFPHDFFVVHTDQQFVQDAFQLVIRNPCDVLHLSKPRIHNVIFGWLYQLVWGAKVIMDVDDEELALVNSATPLYADSYIRTNGSLPKLENLRETVWTRLAVGLVKQFDSITVSNQSLLKRYGGMVIPHVRPLQRFSPSTLKRESSRRTFSIPQDKYVVLFFGTPRKHKGVGEAAKSLAMLNRNDICYVIAGDKPDLALKRELDSVSNLEIMYLGAQPYEKAQDVLAIADACILLQDSESPVSEFQSPAKMIDAFAMEVTVFAEVTPPIQQFVESGAIIPVTRDNIGDKLAEFLSSPSKSYAKRGREIFEGELCVEAVAPAIQEFLIDSTPRRAELISWDGQLDRLRTAGMLPKGVPLPNR